MGLYKMFLPCSVLIDIFDDLPVLFFFLVFVFWFILNYMCVFAVLVFLGFVCAVVYSSFGVLFQYNLLIKKKQTAID